MTFEEEVQSGFSEGQEPMDTSYLLSNEPHSGTIRQSGEGFQREPGYELVDEIAIVSPLSQFLRSPDKTAREIVQIDVGPFAGKWVVVNVTPSVAHYTLTCKSSD